MIFFNFSQLPLNFLALKLVAHNFILEKFLHTVKMIFFNFSQLPCTIGKFFQNATQRYLLDLAEIQDGLKPIFTCFS
jgi:hypothetical protein